MNERTYQRPGIDFTLHVQQQFCHLHIAAMSRYMQRRQIVLPCHTYIHTPTHAVYCSNNWHQGRRPRQKSRRDNKMMYRTSMYAVREYQTSKAGAIIESKSGGLRCFSLSLYSFSSPLVLSHLLQNPFSVPKSWDLASAASSPPSGSERSPTAKHY